ncbi:MAG: aryl-sulfate sulfotransferase [Bacteroidia bacterium]
MIKYLFLLFAFIPSVIFSQNIPAYSFTIYDTTVTGYYFLANIKLGNPGGYTPTQLVLDAKGDIIYYKMRQTWNRADDFKLQPNGSMSYFSGSKFYILDSTFTVKDSAACVGYPTDGHDMKIIGNNHYLLLGTKDSIMDLTSYHMFYHIGAIGSATAIVTGNIIQELDSSKNVVFEWSTFDHFLFDDVSPFWLYSGTDVDWTHCNAVELDTDGNILLSTRHLSEITKIDHVTGNIIWRMGGKQNEFTFINDSLIFHGQHDIQRIDNGNLTLYDNGRFFMSHGARGVEYLVDEVNKTAGLVWSYTRDSAICSYATGNVQRVSDNRTLIDFGAMVNSNICFTLVDSLNNTLAELSFGDSAISYRSFFYPSLPWSFYRPQLNCYQQGASFYLETTAGYSSYLWSTGETAASIQISSPGNYYVSVPYGEGFIRSEIFLITNLSNSCNTNSENELQGSTEFFIYPNPVKDELIIINESSQEKSGIEIYDVYGRKVFSFPSAFRENTVRINTKNWGRGLYFVQSGNRTAKFVIE